MRTFSGAKASQRPDELRRFIQILQEQNCTAYLEVGARHGDTFHAVMSALPKGSVGVAIDLPGGPWGTSKSQAALEAAVEDLRKRGYGAHAVFGDAAHKRTRDAAQREVAVPFDVSGEPPFDACLIDGDHRYKAVMRDFENFAHLARILAFHDIDGHGVTQKTSGLPVEVPQAWSEIKAKVPEDYGIEEIIGAERGMGIGVVYQWDAFTIEGAGGQASAPPGSPPEADDGD